MTRAVVPLRGPLPYNLLLEAELRRILHALDAASIPSVVLKGIPLTRRLHGRLDAREMVDNDVLVRPGHVLQAVRCLEQLGYHARKFHSLEGDLRSDSQTALYRLVEGKLCVWVDLHWSAFPANMFPMPEELQWARTEALELGPARSRVFDPAMTVVHLAAHFAQHHCCHPRVLRDLAAAWNTWHARIDVRDLEALATQAGLWPTLVLMLTASEELGWLTGPLPPLDSRRARWLGRLLPSARLASKDVFWYGRILFTALLLEGGRAPSWLLGHVTPPIDRMAAIYETAPSPWLYLRYPTRPFRALQRLVSGTSKKPVR